LNAEQGRAQIIQALFKDGKWGGEELTSAPKPTAPNTAFKEEEPGRTKGGKEMVAPVWSWTCGLPGERLMGGKGWLQNCNGNDGQTSDDRWFLSSIHKSGQKIAGGVGEGQENTQKSRKHKKKGKGRDFQGASTYP